MKNSLPLLVYLIFLPIGLLVTAWMISRAFARGTGASPADSAESAMRSVLNNESRRLDAAFMEGINSRADWEARRPELHRQYMEMLGLWPMPERTPLDAKVTGTIERGEGFRVEKLHFQSRPHLYVTGNLYLPKDAAAGAKLPAVLYVCGHSGRGRDGNKTAFQHHGMWFATHGYACLIIDTLQLGEIAAIHHGTYRENRWWWQARGYTPAAVECWNGMRALDYLQSRPEVDPERLAVTGISGGGAATFWIAAADERVKVAVPVSGMSDLEDYVAEKVVNGHCDCMFLINTFQWPWTNIAALVAPRPLLFANSGHDTIFPMTGNERIRTRLEKLYGFFTDRTSKLFDVGVTPGGHDDNPELRLMAYRWINHHLKGDDGPVSEPVLPKIEAKDLRAFPDALPADELNSKIDESFVPAAVDAPPKTAAEFDTWRAGKLKELRRLVFRAVPEKQPGVSSPVSGDAHSGTMTGEPGVEIPWKYFPGKSALAERWLVILSEDETMDEKPGWLEGISGDDAVILVAPRGSGPGRWPDPPPFNIQRSLPLLGRTVDTCRLIDVLSAAAHLLSSPPRNPTTLKVAGRGAAGVIGAYAALLEPRIAEIAIVDPPSSHRNGPIFLNVLRVVDIPGALAMLAPRPLTIVTNDTAAFATTSEAYRLTHGTMKTKPVQ